MMSDSGIDNNSVRKATLKSGSKFPRDVMTRYGNHSNTVR